jgi:hypothetical protein
LAVLKQRQNIVLDENEASERLGVSAGQLGAAPSRPGAANAPVLEVVQDCRWTWRGIGIGSGTITLKAQRNDRGDLEYNLQASYKALLSSRSMKRILRFVNEETRETDGGEKAFYMLRDTARDKKPVSVMIEKTNNNPQLFMIYDGIGGEIRVGPAGFKNPF